MTYNSTTTVHVIVKLNRNTLKFIKSIDIFDDTVQVSKGKDLLGLSFAFA